MHAKLVAVVQKKVETCLPNSSITSVIFIYASLKSHLHSQKTEISYTAALFH